MGKNITKTAQNCSINFLRFMLIMIICYLHQTHQELVKYSTAYYDPRLNLAGMGVECFFIMAGYFLFFTKKDTLTYIKDRIIRLWPLMALSLGIAGLMRTFHLTKAYLRFDDLMTLLFLQTTGVSQGAGMNGVAWFVCILFWVSILFILIKKIPNNLARNLITIVLIIWSFIMIWLPGGDIMYSDPRGFSPYLGGFFSIFLMRGIYSVGVGFLLGAIQENEIWTNQNKKNMTLFEVILFVILVYFLLGAYGYLPLYINNILIMTLFSMLFILFINQAGYLSSKFLNHKIFNLLGAWSYAIYIMQNVMFFLTRYLATYPKIHNIIMNHPKFTITISMLMYLIIGILSYYLIEFILFSIKKITIFFSKKQLNA